jgi:hypothetical protein
MAFRCPRIYIDACTDQSLFSHYRSSPSARLVVPVQTVKFVPEPHCLPEEWNDQFLETNPSCERNEKSEHTEKYNCGGFVWSFRKRL